MAVNLIQKYWPDSRGSVQSGAIARHGACVVPNV
jgi:hypothetical protein